MIKITLEDESGKQLAVGVQRAKEIYEELKELFEEKKETVAAPSPQPNPYIGPGKIDPYNPWKLPDDWSNPTTFLYQDYVNTTMSEEDFKKAYLGDFNDQNT